MFRPELVKQYSMQRPNGVAVIPPLESDCNASTENIIPSLNLPLAVPTSPSNGSGRSKQPNVNRIEYD